MKPPEELIATIAPLLKKRIEDALEPLLQPVACELEREGEEERKRRETFLALAEKKLARRQQKLSLQRRRRAAAGGRFRRPTRRVSSLRAKSWRLSTRQALRLTPPTPH